MVKINKFVVQVALCCLLIFNGSNIVNATPPPPAPVVDIDSITGLTPIGYTRNTGGNSQFFTPTITGALTEIDLLLSGDSLDPCAIGGGTTTCHLQVTTVGNSSGTNGNSFVAVVSTLTPGVYTFQMQSPLNLSAGVLYSFQVYPDFNSCGTTHEIAMYNASLTAIEYKTWMIPGVTCPTPVLSNSGAGCLRDVMTLSGTATATSIVWNKNGVAVARPPLSTTYTPGLRGVYSATVTYSNGCVVTSNLDTLVDYYVPSVAINFNRFQAKVCQGTNITFTARTNSVGTANHYQWRVSGANMGTDSTGFTYVPTNLDTVTCILTTNARCIVKPTTTSGKSIVTVYNHPCPRGVPSLQNGSYKMDEEASIFSIYPNPASSILNLQIATEGDLRIVNEIGQAVVEQHLTNQQTQININHLATGVYFYTFQSEGQVFRGKVVKE